MQISFVASGLAIEECQVEGGVDGLDDYQDDDDDAGKNVHEKKTEERRGDILCGFVG